MRHVPHPSVTFLLKETCQCPRHMTRQRAFVGLAAEMIELQDELANLAQLLDDKDLIECLTLLKRISYQTARFGKFQANKTIDVENLRSEFKELNASLRRIKALVTPLEVDGVQQANRLACLYEISDVAMMREWCLFFIPTARIGGMNKDDTYLYTMKAITRHQQAGCIRSDRHVKCSKSTEAWPILADANSMIPNFTTGLLSGLFTGSGMDKFQALTKQNQTRSQT